MTIIFTIINAYFIADFVSGIGHWLQDRYATIQMRWIAKSIVVPNMVHHKMPKAFLSQSYWKRNDVSIFLSLTIGVILYFLGALSITSFLVLLIISQINEVHAFSHRTIKETPKFVLNLQRIGIFQSKKHHNLHHSKAHNQNYCILSNFLNPVLEKVRFFDFLELIILKTFNIKPNE